MRMLLCAALAAVAAARKLPKAVVINLPKHEARYEGAKRELTAAGVSFERMDAVEVRLRLRDHRLPFPARVQHTFRRSLASPCLVLRGRRNSTFYLCLTLTLALTRAGVSGWPRSGRT